MRNNLVVMRLQFRASRQVWSLWSLGHAEALRNSFLTPLGLGHCERGTSQKPRPRVQTTIRPPPALSRIGR